MTNLLEMTDEKIRQQFSENDLSRTRDCIDVTSNHRPDVSWRFVDSAGHEHRWYVSRGRPAVAYHPQAKYSVPSVKWAKTGIGYYEDGTEYETGIYRCKKCGEDVTPGYTADQTEVYIVGMTHYYLRDKEISKSEAIRFVSVFHPDEVESFIPFESRLRKQFEGEDGK